ncbi:hypothetical protein HA402_003114 [Bradysia odoriphaga]|nr:hypothetical protein HA402_003114 [Bradysia odoriphaga]
MSDSIAIGIDLGTTNSSVAVMRYGKIEVIANEQGHFVTPSYVAFNEHEILVGDPAKRQVDLSPDNTIFDAKRMIGRKMDDPVIQNDLKYWPFRVQALDNEPRIEITYNGEKKLIAPEEISAMILTKMKEIAESYLNEEVKDAVITVPAYFNNGQRQATKDAAEISGLNVLRILNEPTAAAYAYNFNESFTGTPNVLVYDLGGGTFDVSIMNVANSSIIASNGYSHLGGEDFDCRLVDHCVKEFKKKHNIDIQNDRRAMSRLRTACEVAKRELSSTKTSKVELCALSNGIDFSLNVSRARFDEMNVADLKKTLVPVQAALADAKLSKEDVDIILLVGGSTRIPKVQTILQEFFGNKPIEKTINPDEAVAYGAAVCAAILKGNWSSKVSGKILKDVTPLSLGLDLLDARGVLKTCVVIPRNTPIPAKAEKVSVNRNDTSSLVSFKIRQGESSAPDQNYKLGEYLLSGCPKGPRGTISFTTVFEIDENGILAVTSTERSTGKSNGIIITNVSGHLRKQQVEKMIADAEKYRSKQRERKTAIIAKHGLEEECYKIKDFLLLDEDDGLAVEKGAVLEKCQETLDWLQENEYESRDVYEKRYAEIKSFSRKMFDKVRSIFSTD